METLALQPVPTESSTTREFAQPAQPDAILARSLTNVQEPVLMDT
jgi:hypothetical protein